MAVATNTAKSTSGGSSGCSGSANAIAPSDYSKAENWIALPSERSCSADVIYFYPTAYIRTSPDVQPVICSIDDKGMRESASAVFKKQAAAFETAVDIFAPYYRQADGSTGSIQNTFRVYGRAGEPCLTPGCRGIVRRSVQGGRSSFFCPVCQH